MTTAAGMEAATHWVFGYGSLIWNPGFVHVSAQQGLLRGAHRSLSIVSHYHRGTVERPGLVIDLGCGTGLSTLFWSGQADGVVRINPSRQAPVAVAASPWGRDLPRRADCGVPGGACTREGGW